MSDLRLTQTEVSLNPAVAEMVNITINGVELKVPKGENVIEAARRAEVDIPYFCYHPRLSKGDAANCRMCLVEVGQKGPDGSVRMMPKPQASCTLPSAEGMVIQTETEKIAKDRKGILEFLLINHPLDCPICDRGGECPLQNNTLFYGPSLSRYVEEKRHYPKAYPLSNHVVFDRERCIHCARCTRFTEDISGDAQLGFLKRGADIEVATFAQTTYKSRFSGNVIELCPVGALLSKDYRFKARPWDLQTQKSVCSKCSNGCNLKIDYRMDLLVRMNARLNEEVNEEWTCDRGKFGHDYVSAPGRLDSPMMRQGDTWTPISWTEAYARIAAEFKNAGGHAGGIGGARLTNEDNFAFQHLFRDVLGINNLDHRTGRYQGPVNAPLYDRFGFHGMGNSIQELEGMKSFFLFGSALVEEQPMLYLRVRKAWRFKNAQVVNAASFIEQDSPRIADFASLSMVYNPGTEIALLNGLLNVLFAEALLPDTAPENFAALKGSVQDCTPEQTEKITGVPAAQVQQAARKLANGPMAVIAGREVQEHPYYADIAAALGNLLVTTGNPVKNLNVPPLECNTQGAADMGVLPDMGPGYRPITAPGLNTHKMLESAAAGELKALWIAGADLAAHYHDPELVNRAFAKCPFVVVSELAMTETAKLAHLVLPAVSMAEKEGTYTSAERRVQRLHKAFENSAEAKPDWLIFSEAASLISGEPPFFSARDIFRAIAGAVPPYCALTLAKLGEGGVRWSYPEEKTYRPTPAEYRPAR